MKPLSQRQIAIIKAIVEEYTSTGEPVGSDTLDKKYNLGVSPATIRNEMVRLEDLGYLKQPHTSAGRIPTPIALKLYVTELMSPQELPVTEEVAVKERIWDHKEELEGLLREVVRILSEKTGTIGVAVTSDGNIYSSGYANVLVLPEFFDIDVTRTVLSMVESPDDMLRIIARITDPNPVHILIGDDFGLENLYSCGMAYIDFTAGPITGHIGVIGPARLNYSRIMPMLSHLSSLINEISGNWS